ncbi:MAG TPA: DUF4189 domain-containing protein, partial [Thermodesulfobacteriota bacterium]|nr:DUF4189 domain-containing protein [Thermodesulfobacteriota bacterium]
SRVMVLVFSSNANESQQIIREVERAVSKGIPVIPFRVEDVDPNKSLEYFISAPHWLDALTPPLEKHLGQLLSTIKLLLSRQGARPEPPSDENAAGASGASKSGSESAYKAPDPRMETIRPLEKKDYSGGRPFLEDKKKLGGLVALVLVLGLAGYLIFGGGDEDKNNGQNQIIPPPTDYYQPPVYTPSPPGPYDNEGNWGAITIAPSGGWGFSTNMSSKQAAEKDAIERCSQFNTGCELKVSFNNCAVYAIAPDGSFGWATNTTVDLARNNAVSECHKYTNDLCSSFIELCSDGSVKKVNVWGAIATADNGQYGSAWNYPTRVQAEKASVDECAKYGPNCQMRISFTDCGAVARSEDGALGWGYYADMNQAVKGAMEECDSRSEKQCSILTQVCADGSERK